MAAVNPIWFMRHGQTNYNLQGLCNSDPYKPVHLTEAGKQQARQAAQQLRAVPLQKILVSQLPRTAETAAIINEYHAVPIHIEPQINDIRSGFEDLPVGDYQAAIAADRLHLKFNEGESLLEHKQRIVTFLERLQQQKPRGLLVVAHEETLRVIKAYFEQLDDAEMIELQFQNCEILQYDLAR